MVGKSPFTWILLLGIQDMIYSTELDFGTLFSSFLRLGVVQSYMKICHLFFSQILFHFSVQDVTRRSENTHAGQLLRV